jgi:hypothetical protein
MALKQEASLLTGLGVAAVVLGITAVHMPTVAAARASAPGNKHINSARTSQTAIAAGVVVLASLLAKDPTVFVIGGTVVIAVDFAHRLANSTDNQTGKVVTAAAPVPSDSIAN